LARDEIILPSYSNFLFTPLIIMLNSYTKLSFVILLGSLSLGLAEVAQADMMIA